jgi:hypothetical protein
MQAFEFRYNGLKHVSYSLVGPRELRGLWVTHHPNGREETIRTERITINQDGSYNVDVVNEMADMPAWNDHALNFRVHDGNMEWIYNGRSNSLVNAQNVAEVQRQRQAFEAQLQADVQRARDRNARIHSESDAVERREAQARAAQAQEAESRYQAQTNGSSGSASAPSGTGEPTLVGSVDPWYSPEARAAREAKWDAASAAAQARQQADADQLKRDNAAKNAADAAKRARAKNSTDTAIPR